MDKPKSIRMKMHEANRPPEYLQGYIAEEMDKYIESVEADAGRLADTLKQYVYEYGQWEQSVTEIVGRTPSTGIHVQRAIEVLALHEKGYQYQPTVGDRVVYKPTGETGIVRSQPDEYTCLVVYDLKNEKATLASDWPAQLTPRAALKAHERGEG